MTFNDIRKKAPSQVFNRALNRPLINLFKMAFLFQSFNSYIIYFTFDVTAHEVYSELCQTS